MATLSDWEALEAPLAAACDSPGEPTAGPAVRAAELVAATAGEPADDLPDADREWVETHGVPPDELIELACRATKALAALSEAWHERLNDLRFRLGDVAAA